MVSYIPVPLTVIDPDPTPFFIDFKDTRKIIFFHIFSFNLPAGTLSSVLKILPKNLATIFFCKHFFSPLNTFIRKWKDPDPYH